MNQMTTHHSDQQNKRIDAVAIVNFLQFGCASGFTKNYAPKTVNWTSNTDGVTVDINGHVTVAASVTATTATITATSTFDNTKSGTCEVTITE